MKASMSLAAACAALALAPAAAKATPATDTLAYCLVQNASPKDQAALMRWMFGALSANPALRDMASTTPEQLAGYHRALAATFERLALVDCRKEMLAAMKADGPDAVKSAFEILGRRAAEQLMSDPDATRELERFAQYLDSAKWEALGREAGLPSGDGRRSPR